MNSPVSEHWDVVQAATRAKASTAALRILDENVRRQSLHALGQTLLDNQAIILAANELDVAAAKSQGLSAALVDRLVLNASRLKSMADAVGRIADSPEVLGSLESFSKRPDGLEICKKRIPLGVIAVIFESRPNVLIDCAALAIKSGNAILLKGGSEATHSNHILGELVKKAIAGFLPADCVQVIPGGDRKLTLELVKLTGLVDLVIPRGGEGLIRMIQEHARVPVIAHAKGLCHLYLHADADPEQAMAITVNAKTQRPGVCNAIETLLVHESLTGTILPELFHRLQEKNVTLLVDKPLLQLFPHLQLATDEDWDTEYLDSILSVKLVHNEAEAIDHILKHSSNHTEAIVARDPHVIDRFESAIDASCIAINASTRFNDGGELGLGAEIGISTTKLHAYGPMGARELTTSRFVVRGEGHCRN